MDETFAPTLAAAQARIAAVRPAAYARTRNALDGAVSNLSPYITHGFVTLADVLAGVAALHALDVQHKFVYELGWRAYFRHVWQHRGQDILRSLHEGPLPDDAYARELPADIRQGCTGVPVVDEAVRALHATGTLHNHARMWLASYVVHVRKVHWRAGADWLYGHLLDTSYDALERMVRQPVPQRHSEQHALSGIPFVGEPLLGAALPDELGLTAPDAAVVKGRDVWLVHPWSLGELPWGLPADTLAIGVFVADFHRAWPWSERRWRFVGSRMAELAAGRWHGDAACIGAALKGARRVRSIAEPHLAPWLTSWAACEAAPLLFPPVDGHCDSFSQWWAGACRGLDSAADLLAVNEVPAW